MVSESKVKNFPWEQQAAAGQELPEGLEYPDQVHYLQLRTLYSQLRQGIIDRPTAAGDKKKLQDEYRLYLFRNQLEQEWVQVIKATELARAEYRKDRTLENADRLVAIIEGRKL